MICIFMSFWDWLFQYQVRIYFISHPSPFCRLT